MVTTKVRADEIIPGEMIDTHCGIGSLAFKRVTAVCLIENDNPNMPDLIEITIATDAMSRTLIRRAGQTVDVVTC